ncbi:MAG TPA: ornithine carbamoyltransferase [Actinomycetaceae bacterium]|nr:ornithine carbamoyltransferase [Actinomycetaceae bacterium]
MSRHFLRDDDLSTAEQSTVLATAAALKSGDVAPSPLQGSAVAIIFDKPTLRTQASFTAGIAALGGYPMVVDGQLAQIGQRESVADVARVLGRMTRAIVWRTFAQARLDEMAAHAGVPVINALTDLLHPCQILADLLTIAEHRGGLADTGPALQGRSLAYIGDGANNMAHSYLLGGARAGLDVRIASPAGYTPQADIVAAARRIAAETGARITLTDSVPQAVAGVDAVATDTWVSMGQEAEQGQRLADLEPYRVDAEVMAASDDAIFLHCLPAQRGQEVTADVLDGPASVIWDEAENRLHVQKAVLHFLVEHP